MQMVQNVATKVRNVFTLVLARKSSFYATWHLTLTNKNHWLLNGNSKDSRKILLLWIVISYAHYRNPPVWRTNSNIMWGIAKLLARLFAQPVQFYKQMSKGLKNHAFSKLCLKVYFSSISKWNRLWTSLSLQMYLTLKAVLSFISKKSGLQSSVS